MSNAHEMTWAQAVPSNSKYLGKDDVDDGGFILTVRGCRHEDIEMDNQMKTKLVMYFVEDIKPLIVNKTNSSVLEALFGPAVSGSVGHKVIVYNDPTVGFGGKVVGGLRIKSAEIAAPRAAPARMSPGQPGTAAEPHASFAAPAPAPAAEAWPTAGAPRRPSQPEGISAGRGAPSVDPNRPFDDKIPF